VRIVLDTNVLVSAFLFGGVPLEVVSLVRTSTIEAVASEASLLELMTGLPFR
jgi:predicted nucleic acid-binding protein